MLASTAARNMSLDAKWGANHSTVWPSSIVFALYTGDPTGDGVELTGGGYAAVTMSNDATTWVSAANGRKVTAAAVTFPTSTGAWTGAGNWIVIKKTDGTLLEAGPIASPISVSTSGRVISFVAGDIAITEQLEVT